MAYVGEVKVGDVTGKIGSTLYGTCSTGANTPTKQVSIAGLDTVTTGLTIHVKFTNTNTATRAYLRIPSAGNTEYPIYRYGITPAAMNPKLSWNPGAVVSLTFTGNAWVMNDFQDNTTYDNATHSTPGLMSAEDKTDFDLIRANRTTSLVFTNVQTSTWAEDTTTYEDYKFKASISCTGVTANHFVEVCFAPDDIVAYSPASVAQSGEDVVYVWVMVNPGHALTIPTVFAVLPDRT